MRALCLRACLLAIGFVLLASHASAQGPLTINYCTFGTYSIGPIEAELVANGGVAPYTWEVTSGALPAGLHIRRDGAPWFTFGNSGIIGVATTPGVSNFALRVTDSNNQTADQAGCSLTITNLAAKGRWDLRRGFVGELYSETLSAQGAAGPVVWGEVPWNPMPAWLTLSSDGILSGTPTAGGYFNVTVSLSDGVDTVYRGFNIQVFDVRITTPGMLPPAAENAAYSTTLQAAGGTPPYTFATDFTPEGLTLEPDGHITGLPNMWPGKRTMQVTVTDAAHVSYTKTFSLIVVGASKRLPSVTPYGNPYLSDCTVGWPCIQGIGAYNGGVPPFTWTATGLPPGLEIATGDAASWWLTPGDGEISGVPSASGTFNVEVTVTDVDGASATVAFPMHVSELLLTRGLSSGMINEPYSGTLRIIGGNNMYSVSEVAAKYPAGVTFDPITFTAGGTPLENGGFSITYAFADGLGRTLQSPTGIFIGSTTSTVQIHSYYDLGTAGLNQFLSYQLSACCLPAFIWSIDSGALPPGLTLSATGLLSGTPTAAGVYTFLVRAADVPPHESNHALREFQILVTPLGQRGNSNLSFGNVSVSYNTQLEVAGATGSVTWTVAPGNYLPPGMTLNSDGTLTGTPTASGHYFFSLLATDSNAPTAPLRTFYSIDVYPFGQRPPLEFWVGPDLGTHQVGRFTYQLSAQHGAPPYTFSLVGPEIPGVRLQSGQPLPTWFGVNTAGLLGVLTTPGTYTTTLRVTDALNNHVDRQVRLQVTSLADLSSSALPAAVKNVPYSFTLAPHGGSGNYRWEVSGSLPPGLALSSNGVLSGTPTEASDFASFSVQLRDLTTHQMIWSWHHLRVDAFAIAPGEVLPQGTVGTPYHQAFTADCGGPCTWVAYDGQAGLAFDPATAVLSGTPAYGFNGTFSVQASGPAGTVWKNFALYVATVPAQPLTITTTSFDTPTIGWEFTRAVDVRGGIPPYSLAVTGGSLPLGLSIANSGEQVSGNLQPGRAHLLGKVLSAGMYNFTLTVTDGAGATHSRALSLYVSPLALEYYDLPVFGNLSYGVPYSQPLLAMGGTGTYTWQNLRPLPSGLTLNSSTGVVSGTPADTGRLYSEIRATDGNGDSVSQFLSFFIAGPGTGLLHFGSSSDLGTLAFGSFSEFLMSVYTDSGDPPASLSVIATTPLPPGFALLQGSAALSFSGPGEFAIVANATTPGPFSFTLRAEDANGNVGIRTFIGIVSPARLITSQLPGASIGVPYSQQLQAISATTLTWSVSGLPAGMNITPGGLVMGTPTESGYFDIVVTASDTSGVVLSESLFFLVSNIAIADGQILPTAIAGNAFNHTFTATATGGGAISWGSYGLPAGLSLNENTGQISGTLPRAGTFTFFVYADNGVTPLERRFTLYSRLPNPAPLHYPMASTLLADMTAGLSANVALNAQGGTPPYSWAIAPGSTLPAGLALYPASVSPALAPGTTVLAGVPATAGDYSFDLIITDATSAQTRRTFTVNVSNVSIPPRLPFAQAGVPYERRLTAIGGAAPYSFSLMAGDLSKEILPLGMTLAADGTLSGTPASTGEYSFRARVQDSTGDSFARLFSFVVSNDLGLVVTSQNPVAAQVGHSPALPLSTSALEQAAWSLAGGSLPAGMSLVTGDPFAPGRTILAGQPTSPGDYSFTLRATDTSTVGNLGSADRRFSMHVSSLQLVSPVASAANTRALPSASVGTPYSASLKLAGGTPPYTFTTLPAVPLPPGLALSASGMLSGTPTATGLFDVIAIADDSAGDSLRVRASLVVSDGAAPLLSLVTTVNADAASVGAPYDFALDSGFFAGTAPFTWSVATDSDLPAGISLLPGGNGNPDRLGGIPSMAGQFSFDLVVTDANAQTLTIPFELAVSPLVLSVDAVPPATVGAAFSTSLVANGGAAPYQFEVNPLFDLPAGVSLSAGGLLSGTPSAAGNYRIAVRLTDANGDSLMKIVRLTIDNGGQAPALRVSPRPIQVLTTAGTPPATPIHVTSSSGNLPATLFLSGIPGAALSTDTGNTPIASLINFSPLAAGTYVGILSAASEQSANPLDSTTVVVSVQPLPACTYTLTPSSASAPASGATGSVAVSTSSHCAWSAASSDLWLQITAGASGTGSGSVSYTVDANAGAERDAAITIGGQTFSMTQFGASGCSYAISPNALNVPPGGGAATIAVSTSEAACAWTASGLSASPAAGSGSGAVTVTVPPNSDAVTKIHSATIAGRELAITQPGVNCFVSLSPHTATLPAGGGVGSFDVVTPNGCPYQTLIGPSWIAVTSGGSGSALGTVTYFVSANSTTVPRSGSITIAGQTFHINQDALACSVTLNTAALGSPFESSGGAGSIGVSTNGANCAWSAASADAWVTLNAISGVGDAVIGVAVTPSALPRATSLTVGGQTIPLSQAGVTCTYNLQSTTGSVPAAGGNGSVGVIAPGSCAWSGATNDPSWLTISSSGTGGSASVQFVAMPNTAPTLRTGSLTIAGLTYTVTQAAAECSYALGSSTIAVDEGGFTGAVPFSTVANGCSPAAVSYANWISVSTTFSGGAGTLDYTVAPNASSALRIGIIQLSGATFTVTQLATPGSCRFSLNIYGAVFGVSGGDASFLGSPSAEGCTPVVGTDQPSFIGLGALTGPIGHIFTQNYSVSFFPSTYPAVRVGSITFGGTIFRVKQVSW
jgi:Putative Ig domain/Putative binding domain, N-terminal/Viral BACON domain